MSLCFYFNLIITISSLYISCFAFPMKNNEPIVGVIGVETSSRKFKELGKSHMPASYVKFLESGGARVVPIMLYRPPEYYADIVSKINGVLFPGGPNVWNSDGYGRTAKIIFDLAVKLNKAGDYFPLWGTCLGFEFLNYIVANKMWMKACSAEDMASNLQLLPSITESRIFNATNKDILYFMQKENVTYNLHQYCLTQQNYTLSGLDKYYNVLATSQDRNNVTYIAVIEAYNYPFYGVAFHPEKILFEWTPKHKNNPHSSNAVKVSQYFSSFFVNEARKNYHKFPNKEAEDKVLIYNYIPDFTGKTNSSTEQEYFFS